MLDMRDGLEFQLGEQHRFFLSVLMDEDDVLFTIDKNGQNAKVLREVKLRDVGVLFLDLASYVA